MPAAVERCVLKLTAKWAKDPSSRPTPQKKGKDGKPQDAKNQAWAICTAAHNKKMGKLEQVNLVSLEGLGPTVLGGAVTNRPHILGLPEISIVEEDDKEKLVVPFLRKGKFRHHTGLLEFNDQAFEVMIDNFNKGVVGRKISLDNRHKPELGAVAWFESLFVDEDGVLKAKADPTPTGLQTIKDRNYMYASIEFNRNWESPEIKFSSDEFEDFDDIPIEEEDMDTVTLEQYQEEVAAREKLEAELAKVKEGQVSLESSYRDMIADLRRQNAEQHVRSIILEAEGYRDSDQRGHPKALLDWAGKVLRFEAVSEDVTLEDENDTGKYRAYIRKAVANLLQTLPGTVPLESVDTEPEDDRNVELDAPTGEYTEEEKQAFADFWEA